MTAASLAPDVIVEPVCGFFLIRFGPRRPEVPARIFLVDHEPGDPTNPMDRGDGWRCHDAELCGEPADPLLVMRARERREISESDYKFEVAQLAWLRVWRPNDPRLTPMRLTRVEDMEAREPE